MTVTAMTRPAKPGRLCILSRGLKTAQQEISEFTADLRSEAHLAYEASPFSALSRDCFSRFWRDPNVTPRDGDVMFADHWSIVTGERAGDLCALMAEDLSTFLSGCMGVSLKIVCATQKQDDPVIVLNTEGGGRAGCFFIDVAPGTVTVCGSDDGGLRDGVVRLVDLIGLRRAPILSPGRTDYEPRLDVRLGAIPEQGSVREAAFLGYNALTVGWFDTYELSDSDAVPQLARFRDPDHLARLRQRVSDARRYGLAPYAHVELRKLPGGDPLFVAHPDMRGALVWKADGEFVVCTEHPLMQRYLSESMAGLFLAVPELAGLNVIVGGESFYHCFMRPHDEAKGHTSCPRCEALGPHAVVANLVNRLAAGARRANPSAQIVAWPYSASSVWSDDAAQLPMIQKMEPNSGAVLMTEMEKDERVRTPPPQCIDKRLWDYSIHLIGPGPRASKQIAACHERGVPVHMKTEVETGFEGVRLPHLPCVDRWLQRAESMANCGAAGAWTFPNFRPFYASTAAEIFKWRYWSPAPEPEPLLSDMAARIAGEKAGPRLRRSWHFVSEAIDYSPELPPYYTGPAYLGPAHPMCCDPAAPLPDIFLGRFLFQAEVALEEGMKLRPTYLIDRRGEPVEDFAACHERMAHLLGQAAAQVDEADALVPAACRLSFNAEASSIRWFYRTARTHSNFYKSCAIRDQYFPKQMAKIGPEPRNEPSALSDASAIRPPLDIERQKGKTDKPLLDQWRDVLLDELENTRAALPLAEADVRLDCKYGRDHSFSHMADMIRAKLKLLDDEIGTLLPKIGSN